MPSNRDASGSDLDTPTRDGGMTLETGGTPSVSTITAASSSTTDGQVSLTMYNEMKAMAERWERDCQEARRMVRVMTISVTSSRELSVKAQKDLDLLLGKDVHNRFRPVLWWWKQIIWGANKCLPPGWTRFEMTSKKHPCTRTMAQMMKDGQKLPKGMLPQFVWYQWWLPSVKLMMHVWRSATVRKLGRLVEGNSKRHD